MANDADIQKLIDESQIRSLIYRYCRSIDRRQYDLLRTCYHPDATDHHGEFFGGVDEFVSYVQSNLPSFERSMHFIGNLFIEIDGDTAKSEAYTLALAHMPATASVGVRDNIVALRYVDELVRYEGDWRIMRRQCVYEWTRTDIVPEGWDFSEYFLRGRPDHDDPVFHPAPAVPSNLAPAPRPRDI